MLKKYKADVDEEEPEELTEADISKRTRGDTILIITIYYFYMEMRKKLKAISFSKYKMATETRGSSPFPQTWKYYMLCAL
jgi:hypothetical protein